jgi:importin subunit beta-1
VQHINGFVQLTPTSQEASEQQLETLNLLCGVTSAIITKLYSAGDQASKAFDADSVMHALIAVFSCRDGYVPEDAMLAVGALTYLTGKQFERYMPAFYPFLEKGLQQTREWQTCLITLGILGDVCRALDEGFVPYCDSIMQILARSLEDPDVPKAVKPSILASFGDIAIAIGDNFIKYLGIVAPPLQGAAEMSIQLASVASDEDEMDYVNSLRQNILDAWSGMFNGLTKQAVDQHLKPFTEFIIYYVETIAADAKNEDLSVLNRAVGVLGDAAANITGIGVLFQQKTFVKVFLEYCQTKPGLDEKSAWSLKMVDAALANTRS